MSTLDQVKRIAEEVFDALGIGQSEAVYDAAFGVGLRAEGIVYDSQRVVPVTYKGLYVGYLQPDYIIGDLVVELKTAVAIQEGSRVQLNKYLRQLDLKNGVLINFPYSGSHVEIEVVGPPPETTEKERNAVADQIAYKLAFENPGKQYPLSDGNVVSWTSGPSFSS
jgi:GxxExxY protein